MNKFFRCLCLLLLFSVLTGCFSWIRIYQTYLQLEDFDTHFLIAVDKQFSVHFKAPILYSEDFSSLLKLQPSVTIVNANEKIWRYSFRKIDKQGQLMQPAVAFYFDLYFNHQDLLTRWVFSPMFLEMVPAEFLEASLRSLAGAKINKGKRQLKANFDQIEKISATLPQQDQVLGRLGAPLRIKEQQHEVKYHYHFQLNTTTSIAHKGRTLNAIDLTFNRTSQQLVKLSSRFAGLKIAIDYRKYLATH